MRFLALSIEHDPGEARAAAEKMGIRMPVVTTADEVLAPLGITGVPGTVFVDGEGTILATATGPRSLPSMEKRARALLDR